MAEIPAPEAWQGKIVSVSVIGVRGSITGKLVQVGDRGLVLRVTKHASEANPSILEEYELPFLTFHPWNTITIVQKVESALDQPNADAAP
jgi:hypothetical protein